MRTAWDKCTPYVFLLTMKKTVGPKAITELYGLEYICFLTLKKR